MKCRLHLPYTDFDNNSFYATDDMLNNSYDEVLYKTNKEIVNYTTCECDVLSGEMKEENPSSLITYAVTNDVVVLIVKFDFNTFDEEFETELKMWIDGHNKISSNKLLSDDDKFKNEPKRTFKLSFNNLKNEEVFLELNNCKLLEPIDNDGYAILIEKISFSSKC